MPEIAGVDFQSTMWTLVAGGFHQRGGMDKANAALARYLKNRGARITLISHEIDEEFNCDRSIRCIVTPRLLNSSNLSDALLAPMALLFHGGRLGAKSILVANGGNVATRDVNWVHFVHRSWQLQFRGDLGNVPAKDRFVNWYARLREKRALRRARLVIANSERTRQDLLLNFAIPEDRIRVVWLGTDPHAHPVTARERGRAREKFGVPADAVVAAFVGAVGRDGRKGFETLFESWLGMIDAGDWDVRLLVAGQGDALEYWRSAVSAHGLEHRIILLGFRTDVPDVLAASDVLVSPSRYESYGLNVHEALARGIPAIVSRSAGVAGRYTEGMSELLLDDPRNVAELEEKLRYWRDHQEEFMRGASEVAGHLKQWTWNDMAAEIVRLATEEPREGVRSPAGQSDASNSERE